MDLRRERREMGLILYLVIEVHTAATAMVNDTLLLSPRNHFERRRYRGQIRNASSERSVPGKKSEGAISSAGEIYLDDDVPYVTFDVLRSIVLNIFQPWFRNYAQIRICMDIIAFVRSAFGELRPRRLRFEQTVWLIIYPFFFCWSVFDKPDRMSHNEATFPWRTLHKVHNSMFTRMLPTLSSFC